MQQFRIDVCKCQLIRPAGFRNSAARSVAAARVSAALRRGQLPSSSVPTALNSAASTRALKFSTESKKENADDTWVLDLDDTDQKLTSSALPSKPKRKQANDIFKESQQNFGGSMQPRAKRSPEAFGASGQKRGEPETPPDEFAHIIQRRALQLRRLRAPTLIAVLHRQSPDSEHQPLPHAATAASRACCANRKRCVARSQRSLIAVVCMLSRCSCSAEGRLVR